VVASLTLNLFVGCAGWSIPSRHADRFSAVGSHLERYAAAFNAVEVNSSFYRPHEAKTYARWASSVPADFRFAVKIPKSITHESRLANIDDALYRFLGEVQGLGEKLGPLLVQLPPSLAFAATTALPLFEKLRQGVAVPIVCEPRHCSWFEEAAECELKCRGISRAAADPAIVPAARSPGAAPDTAYFRLHGGPQMYYSAYSEEQINDLVRRLTALSAEKRSVWCIFDNTAAGAATANAMEVRDRLRVDKR
jgi:uncharacterized protein YecE (DUF72 family)